MQRTISAVTNCTNAMRFVDTNILLYSLDLEPVDPAKSTITKEILSCGDLVMSIQVLQEFYVQATHSPRPDALPHEVASLLIQKWLRFRIQENNLPVLQMALEIKQRFRVSYWDANIIATARISGYREILSEDLGHGQDYGGVRVVNPFL
jgi:predicted nucleic acid-binding protein